MTKTAIETIAIPLTTATGSTVVTIVDSQGISVAQSLGINPEDYTCNCYLEELQAHTIIKSVAQSRIPQFLDEDTDTDRTIKALNVQWESPRKQLNLWLSKAGMPWFPIAADSLLNTQGYPFRNLRLLDRITNSLAGKLGRGGKLGVSISDVGYGLLTAQDTCVIFGSVLYEFVPKGDEMGFINPTTISVTPERAATVTRTTPTVGTTSTTLITGSASNVGYIITNTSATATIYLAWGSGSATTNMSTKLSPNGGRYISEEWNSTLSVQAISSEVGTIPEVVVFTK